LGKEASVRRLLLALLVLPRIFMWCCLVLAAVICLPFAAFTRKR
jgi:hypothetical protein